MTLLDQPQKAKPTVRVIGLYDIAIRRFADAIKNPEFNGVPGRSRVVVAVPCDGRR